MPGYLHSFPAASFDAAEKPYLLVLLIRSAVFKVPHQVDYSTTRAARWRLLRGHRVEGQIPLP